MAYCTRRPVLPEAGLACRLNHGRYSEWGSQPEKQAALAFDGPAYKALSASTLGSEELQYLQSHLRILCGLYGLLRPLDLVKPYRRGRAPGGLYVGAAGPGRNLPRASGAPAAHGGRPAVAQARHVQAAGKLQGPGPVRLLAGAHNSVAGTVR